MKRLLVGLCFALFGVFGQVDANEHTSVDEKIEGFLRSNALHLGFDKKKNRIIMTGFGETKVEAICEALSEMAMHFGGYKTVTEGKTTTGSSQTLIEGLDVAVQNEIGWEDRKGATATRIQYVDANNHDHSMKVSCDFKLYSTITEYRDGNKTEQSLETKSSDVQIIGTLNGILDTMKENGLFSIWFASDDLRDLAVLMILKTRKN